MKECILTISEIAAIEPRIAKVLRRARRIRRRRPAGWPDYSKLKMELYKLVGFYSPHKELRTCTAYETAITALCDALKL